MGRPSNTDQRRAEIVDALLSVMARTGYDNATIAAIAREAGLTSGLLHYHFENKQAILVALVERLVVGLEERVRSRLEAAGSEPRRRLPRRRLHAFIDAHVALDADADPRAVAAWVVVAAEAVRQSDVRRLYGRQIKTTLERLTSLIAACLRAEKRDARSAASIAAATLSAIEGAYMLSASAPGILPKGYAAPSLRKMVDGLLDSV
jgi:TetR/AcrR family transcriptional regulator, transcriptional repressor of bet genes